MSEDLFRLCVVRPPLSPDPRYPPIFLAQSSTFQENLARVASANPDDPRQSLDDTSNAYIASADFAAIDPTDVNNAKLDKAANLISELVGTDDDVQISASGTPDSGNSGNANPSTANHQGLADKLKTAFGGDNLATSPEWFDALEKRLKDSIVALRLVGVEQETGNLAALTTRLRTIEVVRKLTSDLNFPLNADDLQKYSLRPVVAPSFADLQSILSTATARLQAEGVAEAERKEAQAKVENLFTQRLRLTAAVRDIVRLPTSFRKLVTAKPFAPDPPSIDLTHMTLATQHLQLMQNLTSLTLKSFERGLDLPSNPRPPALREGAAADSGRLFSDSNGTSISAIADPLVNMSKTLMDTFSQISIQPLVPPALPNTQETPFTILPTALQHLQPDTMSVFKDLSINVTDKPIDMTVKQLKQELKTNSVALDALYKPYDSDIAKVRFVGGTRVQYQKPAISRWLGAFNGGLKPPLVNVLGDVIARRAGRVQVLGVADLLVVKQQLVGYEGGDVAYIENVLKGETKSREVDTVTSMETDVTNEVETTDSKETDTTTAERFEVSNESDQTIKEDAAVKAGVTVSASYGPTLSVSANASFSNDRSKTDATKTATRYSKDVTTKAVDKIAKRVLQRTVTKTRTETSTKDIHALANTGPNTTHISGVYQWLNKVYEAQTWNYGKRTMLDFLVPEPGAFFLDKQTDPNDNADSITAVPAFTAKPTELDGESYIGFAAQYGVTDSVPPPQEMTRATAAFAAGKDEPHAKADKITIPAGFQVTGISVTATGAMELDKNQSWVTVTCGSFQWAWDPKKAVIGTVTVTTDYILWTDSTTTPIIGQAGTFSDVGVAGADQITKEQGEIPWSITAAYMDNFAVTIEVFLDRTDEALRNWQNTTWARLKGAADKMIADQNAAIEKAMYNSAFQGRNPDKNLAMMRNEMKKNCISIMIDSHFDEFGAIQQSRTRQAPGGLPMSEINLDKAWRQGPFVRFFEQAFEWDEMTWMLYPYYWGRKDHWYRRVDYQDEDPEFEKFVQSGYARANVPVRLGFEGALEHFLNTGKIWQGGALPGISSPLFLPIAAEIQESLGKKAEEPTKYGDPWLVKVPTNLIKLRKDDKPPEWTKDKVTGVWTAVKDVPAPAVNPFRGFAPERTKALPETQVTPSVSSGEGIQAVA